MSGKKYINNRGWKYQVMPGLGENTFKARYQRPEFALRHGWRRRLHEVQKQVPDGYGGQLRTAPEGPGRVRGGPQ